MEFLFVGMLAVHSILFEEKSALGLGNTLANLAVRCVMVGGQYLSVGVLLSLLGLQRPQWR